jgi:hypothetical protein
VARTILGAGLAFVLAALPSAAGAQEALPKEYGYLLAGRMAGATYFMSGIQRGGEPESVEAWVWVVTPDSVAGDGARYDAQAQLSIMRCTARSIEVVRTEYYLGGKFLKSIEIPVGPAKGFRADTPMALIWNTACDRTVRFKADYVDSIDQVYEVAKGRQLAEVK